MKARANDAWWKPVVRPGLTEARWVRAIEIRPARSRAARSRITPSRACSRKRISPGIQNADQGDAFRNAGTFMEWAVGKQGEIMRPNSRQADAARLAHHLGHPLLRRRRGRHRRRRTRHLLLSQGSGAEVPPDAAPDGLRRHRHSAQHGEGDRGFFLLRAERPRRELPAAHAPARQGDGDGGDPAERPDADPQPRGQLQLQLAQQLRLRR